MVTRTTIKSTVRNIFAKARTVLLNVVFGIRGLPKPQKIQMAGYLATMIFEVVSVVVLGRAFKIPSRKVWNPLYLARIANVDPVVALVRRNGLSTDAKFGLAISAVQIVAVSARALLARVFR